MKLIQTPSLITGVILGASLITLSAASNDSALGGLHVFVPGTTVSSADVNANFTYLDDEVTTLGGRVDNLEGSSSQTELLDFFHPVLLPGESASNLSITVPQGYTYRISNGSVVYVMESGTPGIVRLGDPAGAGHPVYIRIQGMSSVDLPYVLTTDAVRDEGIVLRPGTTITFEAWLATSHEWTDLHVQIEKSPYNIQ